MKWNAWISSEKHRKKSVDDLISQSQDAFNQAISLTRRSPSPNKSHKRDKSDVSNLSADTDADSRLLSATSSDINVSAESTSKSLEDLKAEMKKSSSLKLGEKAKKKAWYNVIYPSYKSRTEDFKKLFDIPDDERLLVDYSCAIQKDILVHGRLYVSQNYVCFHANIIVYETRFVLKWKDVTSISKEKVAKVIPNAILITTESEKYFLTSFASRDKSHLMLFRAWQNALMETPMNPQELWQWVHMSYGDQLGLTSDDEDYIDPSLANSEDILSIASNSAEELADQKASSSSSNNKLAESSTTFKKECKKAKKISDPILSQALPEQIPTDMSGSDSDEVGRSKMDFINDTECTSMHEGRQLVHTILPLSIETVFGLMFHKSKFFTDFHIMRKTTNLVQGEWEDLDDGTKKRVISLTVAISPLVGPKSSHVTETQIMRPCSKAGLLYSIDATSENAGIPYADSFSVMLHYCMKRTVDDSTVLSVHAHIKYKKSVLGFIKGFIEKNTWFGLEDFYDSLSQALIKEYNIPPAKAKRRNRKNTTSHQAAPLLPSLQSSLPVKQIEKVATQLTKKDSSKVYGTKIVQKQPSKRVPNSRHDRLSLIVIFLLVTLLTFNVVLFVKLRRLDNFETRDIMPETTPKTTSEWLKVIKLQDNIHVYEMGKWQEVIQSTIDLLKKTEKSLFELQNLIFNYRSKAHQDNDGIS